MWLRTNQSKSFPAIYVCNMCVHGYSCNTYRAHPSSCTPSTLSSMPWSPNPLCLPPVVTYGLLHAVVMPLFSVILGVTFTPPPYGYLLAWLIRSHSIYALLPIVRGMVTRLNVSTPKLRVPANTCLQPHLHALSPPHCLHTVSPCNTHLHLRPLQDGAYIL